MEEFGVIKIDEFELNRNERTGFINIIKRFDNGSVLKLKKSKVRKLIRGWDIDEIDFTDFLRLKKSLVSDEGEPNGDTTVILIDKERKRFIAQMKNINCPCQYRNQYSCCLD